MVRGAAPAAFNSVQFLYFVRVTLGLGLSLGSAAIGLGSFVTSEVGFNLGAIVTPLFQTSFVPDLVQVYFFPDTFCVSPALAHLEPGFGAEAELAGVVPEIRSATNVSAVSFALFIYFAPIKI